MKNLQDVMRHSIQVQLETAKDLDAAIIQRVKELKAERKFTATFREMALLYFSLQEGDTSVLTELFPWLMDAIEATVKPSSDNTGNGESEAILNKLDTLQRAIETSRQPGGHYQTPADAPQMVSGNLGSLAGAKPPAPPKSDDDLMDMLEVKEADRSEVNATQNFINSLIALQSITSPKSDKSSSKPDFRKRNADPEIVITKTK